MKKQKLYWIFGPAVAVTALGILGNILANDIAGSASRIILLPGWMLCVLLSGNPHRGPHGTAGVLAHVLGCVLAWALMSGLVFLGLDALGLPLRF